MEETPGYKNNLIGLKTLKESGRLHFFISDSFHVEPTPEEIEQMFIPFLDPSRLSSEQESNKKLKVRLF